MKKTKKAKTLLVIKTGTTKEFFDDVKSIMRTADKKQAIKPQRTVIFEDPTEMMRILSETKINLLRNIQLHPGSITDIAKATKRNRAAVYRDITELEKFGLLSVRDEVNPGHGHYKIVEATASKLKLEAYIG